MLRPCEDERLNPVNLRAPSPAGKRIVELKRTGLAWFGRHGYEALMPNRWLKITGERHF